MNVFKKLLHILMLILVTATSLHAAPASPDPIDTQQPDGSFIRVRILGDEFRGWAESEETGHTILHNKASGYWEYAEQTEEGKLRPSGIRVVPKGIKAPPAIPRGLRPPRDKERERRMQQMLSDVYQQRLESSPALVPLSSTTSDSAAAEAAPGDWVPVPVSGAKKTLIVLISFADRAMQTAPANWYTAVFDGNAKSVARFYKDNSFGLMTISPVSHTQSGNPAGVVSVTIADNHPNYGNDDNYTTETTILNHALAQAAPYVNFSSFDANGNGTLEQSELAIYFIYAGYEASGTTKTPNIWAHAWGGSPGITAGSKKVTRWAQNGELNDSSALHPMGVIAHELGHALCGLPDLYDISAQNQALGAFSLMAGGSWGRDTSIDAYSGMTPTSLDAWSREFLGWTTPDVPVSSGTIALGHVLAASSSAYKLVNPATSTAEYFLVENRQPVNWDSGLKRWLGGGWLGGLLVLHVDNTSGSFPNNDINSYAANSANPGHQGVVPVQASTVSCNMLSVGSTCAGRYTTLFYSANNASLTPSGSPNSNYYNGSATNFSLTGISAQGSIMTAFLLLPPSAPSVTTMEATSVGATAATLNGTVNDNNALTAVTFEYGLTSGYGSTASAGTVSAGSGNSAVSAPVAGLACNSTYHFRVSGTNLIGTGYGVDKTFTTTACPPGAPTVTSVAAGNSRAIVYFSPPAFDGGSPIISYTVTPSSGLPVSGDTVPFVITGLVNGTAYSFTVKATNAAGAGPASEASLRVTPGVVIVDDLYETGYNLLQIAYDNGTGGEKIMLSANIPVGGLAVHSSNTKGDVTINGGYNNVFTDDDGLPSILGKVTLSAGKTSFRNVIVRAQ